MPRDRPAVRISVGAFCALCLCLLSSVASWALGVSGSRFVATALSACQLRAEGGQPCFEGRLSSWIRVGALSEQWHILSVAEFGLVGKSWS